jgi:hypothetical protein
MSSGGFRRTNVNTFANLNYMSYIQTSYKPRHCLLAPVSGWHYSNLYTNLKIKT